MSSGKTTPLFLGLDCSTQGLKAVVIDDGLNVVHRFAVSFDTDLAVYKTSNGVHIREHDVVTQPSIMYVHALDALFKNMQDAGFPFANVMSICGSGQQHGSVYLKHGFQEQLRAAVPTQALHEQLSDIFSIPNSPIWMDSSTRKECEELEAAVGGPTALAEITGSRAYERFTAHQITKIATNTPCLLEDTEKICLISSFVCSLLLGTWTPADYSDASGMNLLNIHTKQWDPSVLKALPYMHRVEELLGRPVPTGSVLGSISPYFQQRFSFSSHCNVAAFTGDNPASLVGLGLSEPGDVGISLGTSDTVFGIVDHARAAEAGHIFISPTLRITDDAEYMAMICFKNGSLVRERIRDQCAEGSWVKFDELLGCTPPGNAGRVGIFYDFPEITPQTDRSGCWRYECKDGEPNVCDSFEAAAEVRAVVESQVMAMRRNAAKLGIEAPKRIFATGGASSNAALLQIIADIFNAPVFIAQATDGAAFGAALLARAAVDRRPTASPTVVAGRDAPARASTVACHHEAARADPSAVAVYASMLALHARCESQSLLGP